MKKLILSILGVTLYISLSAQAGLIRHYPLDGNANDVAGGFNGTVVGGVSSSPDETGSPSKALLFNGVDAYVDIPTTALTTLNEYTYSICIRSKANPPSSTAWSVLSIGYSAKDQVVYLSNGGPGGQNGYGFGSYNTTVGPADDTWKGTLPTTGQWYHLTAVRTNTMIKLYIDDILIDSANTTGTTAGYDATPTARIGARSGASWGIQFFNGDIEDLKIYNRALLSSEISDLCEVSTGINDNFNACKPNIETLNNKTIRLVQNTCNIQNFNCIVYDLMGQAIFNTSDLNFQFDLKNMPSGRYICKMEGNIEGEHFSSSKSFFIQ